MSQAPKRANLGRGLAALFGDDAERLAGAPVGQAPTSAAENPATRAGARAVDISLLHPNPKQPRRLFDPEAVQALADSIKTKGLLQPILVRPHPSKAGEFEIVAGERRWRAAQKAMLHEVPIIERALSDVETLEVALVENIQREDLTALEEATTYQRLIEEFGHAQEAVAEAVGKSRSHIANTVRLLQLPQSIQKMIDSGALSAGHGRALLMAKDALALAKLTVARGLNVRQLENLVRQEKSAGQGGSKARGGKTALAKDSDTLALEKSLSEALGMKVVLVFDGTGGELAIKYKSLEQLDDLLMRLNPES